MTTKSKFVSIENDNGEISLCFWSDKKKEDLEAFKFFKTEEAAKVALKYWTSPKKTLEAA